MKVYELLDRPEKWTTQADAKNESGKAVRFDDPNARCWCILGALAKCHGLHESFQIQYMIKRIVGGHISSWNDAPERTYEDVIKLCKELDI